MQHDLFLSLRDLDLRSNFDLHFSKLVHISFEASLRDKNDDTIADFVSLLVQKLFVEEYSASNILTICDLALR